MREREAFLEDIILNEADYLHIEEVPLESEEYELIKSRSLQKIAHLQETELTNCSPSKPKIKKLSKKLKTLLIAAVFMSSATTLMALRGEGTIEGLFSMLFGKAASNIGPSGTLLTASDHAEGISIHLKGALADQHTINLLVDLEKEGGEVFEGNAIKFDQLTLELEGAEKVDAEGLVSWWQYSLVDDVNNPPSTRTLQLKRGSIEGLEGKKATLLIENIIEYNLLEVPSQLTLAECLEPVSGETTEMIPNKDRRYDESLVQLGDEQEIAFKESIPPYLIPSKHLNLVLFNELPELKLNNIVFLDNKLHMRTTGSPSDLLLKDEKGASIAPLYQVSDSHGTYYVYPISNLAELKQVECFITIEQELNQTHGNWEMHFEINTQSDQREILTSIDIPLSNIKTIKVEKINLSQLSLSVTYTEPQRILKYPDISLVFLDGTEKMISDTEMYLNVKSENQRECTYDFDSPIDLTTVQSIKINDQELILP